MHPLIAAIVVSITTLSATATAIAVPEAPLLHSDFSFSAWVDSLIADPSTALTPSEAIAAFNSSLTSSSSALSKRQEFRNCNQKGSRPAKVPEAVWCINYLADRGRKGETCDLGTQFVAKAQCTWYDAQIVSIRTRGALTGINCNEIAKAGGSIMDHCFRADNTVAGEAHVGAVTIQLQMPLV
ncbi:uncharacterized protein K460DRAFT_366273 [Cucurbitaria berberidis CBS 394.84]|uniref:Ecp2 effector protein domain-containing protein n=1 Tax=Cucurbitaria berberidis CBS 394.84 TaxID=1168544 RepID=A0A9P4GGZ5_9PLEO|nr:uncharacterized protein K460DRAFT_366273 [Cucurbitaria berberidis CBS 394.84]KAF1845385.1 hypothetical protein K460DRAFT_366273 [Cucurbitaria berberidis CBS 394.84]